MFVDPEIAFAAQFERKTAVARHLLEHVIVKADARVDRDGSGTVKIHSNFDICLAGLAMHVSRAVRSAQSGGDSGPACLDGASRLHAYARDADIFGQLQVRL